MFTIRRTPTIYMTYELWSLLATNNDTSEVSWSDDIVIYTNTISARDRHVTHLSNYYILFWNTHNAP